MSPAPHTLPQSGLPTEGRHEGFLRFLALLIGLLWIAATPPPPAPPLKPGIGTASGGARARYLIRSPKPVPLAEYDAVGYRQRVALAEGGSELSVEVTLAPVQVREPFAGIPGKLPRYLPPEVRSELSAALRACQRVPEAVEAVLLIFRERLRYVEKTPFREDPAEVIRRGEASCVGMTRLCSEVLASQGVTIREVLGLKVPLGAGPVRLEGGVLHAWLEVECGAEGRFFYDPWKTCGWVPETFVVLGVGSGLDPGAFGGLLGGAVETLSREDRIFYEPAASVRNLLWRRLPREEFTGSLITGKALGPMDRPLVGRAVLRGGGGEASMELWEGNFFFRDLSAGTFAVRVEAPGVPAEESPVTLGPMDKRRVLVYSQDGRKRGNDGAGRQP